jgi:hypothetical protein
MSASKKKSERISDQEKTNYLEQKYGKEPKISTEELKKQQWNWH